MGAPSLPFDQAVADEICERLAKGESLRKICGSDRDDFIPGRTTVLKWLCENEAFASQYARAREAQADFYVEEIVAIADGEGLSIAIGDEAPATYPTDHNRDRLRIDARKWVASKLAPKKYGDKVTNELTGPNGSELKPTVIQLVAPSLNDHSEA
jgi:hypothetical protein